MKFKDFMDLYDNWNEVVKVNDDNLNTIVRERIGDLMWGGNHAELFEMEVVAFGFYDDELCVRVK